MFDQCGRGTSLGPVLRGTVPPFRERYRVSQEVPDGGGDGRGRRCIRSPGKRQEVWEVRPEPGSANDTDERPYGIESSDELREEQRRVRNAFTVTDPLWHRPVKHILVSEGL